GSLSLFQRFEQKLGAYWLDQIPHLTDLKSLQSKLVMGSAKHHRRWRLTLAQPGGHLQAVEARHADVQQHDIRLKTVNQGHSLFAIGGARLQDTVTLEFADHTAQSLSGQGFVINDQDIHIECPATRHPA